MRKPTETTSVTFLFRKYKLENSSVNRTSNVLPKLNFNQTKSIPLIKKNQWNSAPSSPQKQQYNSISQALKSTKLPLAMIEQIQQTKRQRQYISQYRNQQLSNKRDNCSQTILDQSVLLQYLNSQDLQ